MTTRTSPARPIPTTGAAHPSLAWLATGSWGFRSIAAAVDLRLFTILSGGRAAGIRQIAHDLRIRYRSAEALVTACVSLGLLESTALGYRNSPAAEDLLVEGRPGDLRMLLDHHDDEIRQHTAEAIRGTGPVRGSGDADGPSRTALLSWLARESLGPVSARALAASFDFGRYRALLDVGGGSGVYSLELCGARPRLTATVLDRRHACEAARENIAAAGLGDRITCVCHDPLDDVPLPAGHDLVLLAQVISDWDPHTVRAVFERCFAAVARGGGIVVCEPLLAPGRDGPAPVALMGLRRVVETGTGRCYSTTEVRQCLTETGFVDVHVVPVDAVGCVSAVVGRKA